MKNIIEYLKFQIKLQESTAAMWKEQIHSGCDCTAEQTHLDNAEGMIEAYEDILERLTRL